MSENDSHESSGGSVGIGVGVVLVLVLLGACLVSGYLFTQQRIARQQAMIAAERELQAKSEAEIALYARNIALAETELARAQGDRFLDAEKVNSSEDGDSRNRTALWQALHKALPEKYRSIEVYAENRALTQVLFRSNGHTLLFSLKTGKVEIMHHMKLLGKINCITFHDNKTGGTFILWLNGSRELSISVGD